MNMLPLTPEQVAMVRATIRKIHETHQKFLQEAALDRWWQREIRGRYLGEV